MAVPSEYRLLAELASDTLTRTFRGVSASDPSPVIVKVPRVEYPEPRTISLLRHEFALSGGIGNGAVLRALRFEASQRAPALVFADYGGETMASLLSKRKLALPEFLRLALCLARALGEIHRCAIVHNCISSHSILVDAAAGDALFTTLGLGSQLEVEFSERWTPDSILGTLEYISPEQTGRMNRPVDFRSDVYSLGIVFYEMLIGWLPFQSRDPMELVHAHIARRPKSPSELNEDIPIPVSEILLKMLEKNAEHRYQSCAGLASDLETCLARLEETGSIRPFPVGERDTYERFLVPRKLVGREREKERLSEAFQRASDGAARLLLLSGYSGAGKTSLVHESHADITRRNGFYLAGKFEQLQRDIPYAPLRQAFQQFVAALLSMDDDGLAAWRARIAQAVGANGRILLDFVPDLELVIGAQPAVIALPEKEAQNRFHAVLLAFVQAVAQPSHPLVIFLDDCQWIDAASSDFIARVLLHPDSRALLLLCSYRENEVQAGHPVLRMVENAERASIPVERMHLAPLGVRDVVALVAETLHLEERAVEELGALIHAKTQGNPFFLGEFLRSLYAKRLLSFHAAANRWLWSMRDILRENITDNVAELMLARIHTLPEAAQHVLQLAACLGNRFDLHTLATVLRESPARAAAQLWDAIHEGLVIPIDESYRLYQYADERDAPAGDAGAAAIEYKFLHDRVQQSAYDSIPEEERKAVHLRIGRLLLASLPAQRRDETIFTIVHHFNAGAELLRDDGERTALAGRNLHAARKARAAAAYEAAFQYAATGLSLLDEEQGAAASTVTRELLYEAGMCEYLTGRFAEADSHFDRVLEITPDTLAKAAILTSKVTLYSAVPRVDEAIAIASAGLASLGYSLHPAPTKLHVALQLARVQWLLRGKNIAELRTLPEMTDAAAILALELLASMISVAYYRSAEMYALLILKMMELVLRKGVSASAPFVFSQYSAIIAAGFGKYRRAVEFGNLATTLLDRFPHPLWSGRVKMTVGVFSLNWERDFRESLASLHESHALSRQTGDHLYGVWSGRFIVLTRLCIGDALPDIADDLRAALHYARQVNQTELTMQSVDLFLRTATLASPGGDALKRLTEEREELESVLRASTDIPSRMYHAAHMIAAAWLHRDIDEGAALIAASRRDTHGILGQISEAWYRFFCALVLCEQHRGGTAKGRRRIGRAIAAHRSKLAALAANCPANYRHLLDIVDAEIADPGDAPLRALPLHARALAAAETFGAPLFIAIANEAAGRCFVRAQMPRLATVHLREAHAAYEAWGAKRKSLLLEAEFSALFSGVGGRTALLPDSSPVPRAGGLSANLDVLSFVKASHAFSDEIILDKLLRKLIRILLENAGAERGLLLFERGGAWQVEAEGDSSRRDAAVLQAVPLDAHGAVALSVIRYVERTRLPLVLDAAHRLGDFTDDPHIAANAVASILCLPLMHTSRLTGILYMENSLLEGAFTAERIEGLTILSADMAISIENARLFADLALAKTEIELYSRTLEEKVELRTRDLRLKSEELEKAIEHLHTTREQLVHAEKLATLGELTAGIAHEIKNPLNFVTNFAEASDELFDELSLAETDDERAGILSDLRGNLAKIREHGRKADNILRSMMMHARSGTATPMAADINDLAEEAATVALHSARASMPECDVTIEKQFDASLPWLTVVPQDLSRVLLNIMQNGIYAACEKWKSDRKTPPHLTITTSPSGGGVEIRIRDNGPGIPDAIMKKIFQPFFTTKPTGAGTGLGLSMSYDIVVKGHNGSLRAENPPGGGVEFIVTLPG